MIPLFRNPKPLFYSADNTAVRQARYALSAVLAAVIALFSSACSGEIAQFSDLKPVSVQGDIAFNYSQQKGEVWILRNNCQLLQSGRPSGEAAEMVLWVEHDLKPIGGSNGSYRLTVYMEGQVSVPAALNRGFVTISEEKKAWLGELLLPAKPQVLANINRTTPGQMPEIFWRAQRCREIQAQNQPAAVTRVNSALAQQKYQSAPVSPAIGSIADANPNAGGNSILSGGPLNNLAPIPDEWGGSDTHAPLESGQRRIKIYARSDQSPNISWETNPKTKLSVAYIDGGGITVIIDGMGPAGSIDISTDKLVVWSSEGAEPDLNGRQTQSATQPLEIYMEGNIIFRQGDRTVRAQRMYYDVAKQTGTILDTEIRTPADGYDGLLRIDAETVHQLNSREFFAQNAFVTSSLMGKPSYRIQMENVSIRDSMIPVIDPVSGVQVLDDNGNPVANHQQYIDGKNASILIGDTPIFYWPSFTSKLEKPTLYLNSLRLGSDSTYGFQMYTGWDAYQLFGCTDPPEGTDLTINLDPLTNRGIGHGAEFNFDRNADWGLFAGPIKGNIDFWGIYDWGKDNLGEGRRSVVPETKYRYKLISTLNHTFSNGLQLTAQTGLISDRDFMEEYYRDDWYTQRTPETSVRLGQTRGNFSWSASVQAKVNGFYTESQRLPELNMYWLGESLMGDTLTWYSASTAGYYSLRPGTYPESPENQRFFDYLAWERSNAGGRFTTRHELDYPFQAGAVRLVPYVMGEAGWWGADETGSLDRFYGQVGVRAAMPLWKAFPCVKNELFDVNGLVHKATLEMEWYYGSSSQSMYDLPMYNLLDDQSIIQYRHMFSETVFGGPIPLRFDERAYALRSGLGNHVTSPGVEILDDLHVVRLNVNQRWQTKRGPIGNQHIVDWITLDAGVSLFPNADRDNFGSAAGLLNYDFNWRLGDRFAVTSSGLWDFFDEGIHAWSIGGKVNKPGKGELAAGLYFLSGPVNNTVLYINGKYWMSPKWHFSFGSEFDIEGQGNIGQNFAITRVGESLIVRTGFYVDATRDDYGFSITLEPRFLPKGSLSNSMGGVRPVGAYGLE